MSENLFQLDSSLMAKQYVYYERLKKSKNENNRELYRNANLAFNSITKSLNNKDTKNKIVNRLRAQAKVERKKEVQLMNKLYNDRYPDKKNWDDPETVKEFIKFFNYSFGLKDVYERNRQLILSGSKSKAVYSYFDTYLISILKDSQTIKEVEQVLQDCYEGKSDWSKIDETFRDIIKRSFKKMINAKSEYGTDRDDPKIQDAYKALLDYIESPPQDVFGPDFIAQIEKTYGIPKLIDKLKTSEENAFDVFEQAADNIKVNGDPIDSSRNYNGEKGKRNRARQSGEMLEIVESLITNTCSNEAKTSKIKGGRTGPQNFKADNIYTVDIDASNAEEIIQKVKQQVNKTREENIDFFSKLDETMNDIGSGALVYVSAKNYGVNSDSFEEFGAGAALKLKSYERLLLKKQASPQSAEAAIGAIMQLAQGAIGAGNQKKFELLLAKDIAAMLFDDFDIIGEEQAGAYSVHIMDLNGIYVPISTILSSLADAIEEGATSKVVSVQINVPKIEFSTAKKQGKWETNNPLRNAWSFQRNETLNKTKITYHFLQNFTALLKSWTSV